jgi:hypothetical protein
LMAVVKTYELFRAFFFMYFLKGYFLKYFLFKNTLIFFNLFLISAQ